MKSILSFAIATIFISLISWFSINSNSDEGIVFHVGNWQSALERSKKEKKPIFLDVYATWCGPCKLMKKFTFSNKKVGEYFNENYINVALDGETKEGRLVAYSYGVRAYPTLLFLNSEGKTLSFNEGFMPSGQFLKLGKTVNK